MQVRETADIAKVVRRERKRQKLTQVELAGLCGVGPRFIVDLERGKETAKLGLALRVLTLLGIPLTAGGEAEPPSEQRRA